MSKGSDGRIYHDRGFHLDDLPNIMRFLFEPEIFNKMSSIELRIHSYYLDRLHESLLPLSTDGLIDSKNGRIRLRIDDSYSYDDLVRLYRLPQWPRILTGLAFIDASEQAMEVFAYLSRTHHRSFEISSNRDVALIPWMSREVYLGLVEDIVEFENLYDFCLHRIPSEVNSADIRELTRKTIPRCIRLRSALVNERGYYLSRYSQSLEVQIMLVLLSPIRCPRLRRSGAVLPGDLLRVVFEHLVPEKCPAY